MRRTPKTRGFSLIEIMVVLAILAILGTVAVFSLGASKQKAELRSSAQRLVQDLKRAQVLARSGRADIPTWAANDRTVQAGVRFISPTQYAVFVDRDTTDNGGGSEADIEVVDLTTYGPDLQIVSPPTSVRFTKKGTLNTSANVDLTIRDASTSQQHVVRVTFGGKVSLAL